MFNVTLVCSLYGNTLTEQMDAMENVMAHELFHAIFSDYIKENSLRWENENVNNKLLYLMLNEGLAHYISDGELIKEYYDKNDQLKQNEKQAFASLSDSAKVIFNIQNKEEIRNEALNSGLYGQYWDKYVCVTGLFMIYHLEQSYGAEGIKECLKNDYFYFIKKYETLRKTNIELPALPDEIIKYVKEHGTN